MEPINAGNAPASFVQEMLYNKILLLTVVLTVCAVTFLGVGLFVLLGH